MAILLEAGAFVNVQQSNGETALMKVSLSFTLGIHVGTADWVVPGIQQNSRIWWCQ